MKEMILISETSLSPSISKIGELEINSYTWYAIAAIVLLLLLLYLLLLFRKPDNL